METIAVAAWLVLAAVLLGPPLLGVHRSTWPLQRHSLPEAAREDAGAETTPERTPTPAGQCRACGETGQAGFTYCRACLTPLPQPVEGPDADGRDGTAAD